MPQPFTRTKGTMSFSEAVKILKSAKLSVLKDNHFGDRELTWTDATGKEVANGYFGNSAQEIDIGDSRFEAATAYVLERFYKSRIVD